LSEEELLSKAFKAHQKGDLANASEAYKAILQTNPLSAVAMGWLGVVRASQKDYEEAHALLKAALERLPDNFDFRLNLANVLRDLERVEEAILELNVLLTKHEGPAVYNSLASCELARKSYSKALNYSLNALEFNKNDYIAWLNYGIALYALKRIEEAISAFDKALDINKDSYLALIYKGDSLYQLADYKSALSCYKKVQQSAPNHHNVLYKIGATLRQSGRLIEAANALREVIRHEARDYAAINMLGSTLYDMHDLIGALCEFNRAVAVRSDFLEAWANKALTEERLKMHRESARSYMKCNELSPSKNFYLGRSHHQKMIVCDWKDYNQLVYALQHGVENGDEVAEPFGYQGVATSEESLLSCAKIFSERYFPESNFNVNHNPVPTVKIRLAYLCGEFRDHATSHLMIGVWESHQKDYFELIALDNGFDDGSKYRERILKCFDKIIDISALSDVETAQIINEMRVDMLVNLNGFFGKGRMGVFAMRPCPIQVNLLGFPGTLGANYIDYIVADSTVIPPTSIGNYVEKVAYLPHPYQPNDDKREISTKILERSEFGLPENGFVFCCFNNPYKITPKVFSAWMGILKGVKGSCLWLIEDNGDAPRNLGKEAEEAGVDPRRLVFSRRTNQADHLARHRLADLFLDTLPYNAHTTASDSLWAGTPVLTIVGNTFPGRVASSLLKSLKLDELICKNTKEYVDKAILFGNRPDVMSEIKSRLLRNIEESALFKTKSYASNLDLLLRTMYQRWVGGNKATHLIYSEESSSFIEFKN